MVNKGRLPKLEVNHGLAALTSIISLISIIVYCTWYFASVEKKIAVIDQHEIDLDSAVVQIKTDLNRENDTQNSTQSSFQTQMHAEVAQLSNRIEQIYQILLENQRNAK